MKYHMCRIFDLPLHLRKKSSDQSKDLCKLKLLSNFDVNLTSFQGGIVSSVLNV